MPIRPENKHRYPANWSSEIRPRILARAAAKNPYGTGIPVCEECGVVNYAWIERKPDGSWTASFEGADDAVKVVLTIAHLNHQPEDCGDENLRAWCQKCHNAYDMPVRKAGIKARARAQRASGDLFEEAS